MKSSEFLSSLPPSISDKIQADVPLSNFTTWKVGGPAKWLIEPNSQEIHEVVTKAFAANVPVQFIGRGSNLLISDKGFNGLVILTRNSLTNIQRIENEIIAESGVSLPRLSKFAAAQGFKGYEFLIGIPGTVGGGIAMNCGLTVYQPQEITSVLIDFDVFDIDQLTVRSGLTMRDVNAAYRTTDIQNGRLFVIRARFKLEESGIPKEISAKTISHLRDRKSKQPLAMPTAGSTFKSMPEGKSAGWYIEQAGLKSSKVGGAKVSEKHANWIENTGDATAADILSLIQKIEKTVLEKFQVSLEREVCLVGDFN